MQHICKMMKQVAKTTVCLCLCLALIVGYSYKEPVTAHAAEVALPVVDVLIQAALAALGIGIAGTVTEPIYKQIIKNMQTSTVVNLAASATVATVAGQQIYTVSSQFLQAVGNVFMDTYNALLFSESLPNGSHLDNVTMAGLTSLISASPIAYFDQAGVSPIGAQSLDVLHYYPIIKTGQAFTYPINSTNEFLITMYSAYTEIYFRTLDHITYYGPMYVWPDGACPGVYLVKYVQGTTAYYAFLFTALYSGTAKVVCRQYVSDSAVGTAPGRDVINVASDKFYADSLSILNNPVSDVVGRVGTAVGVTNPDGSISIPLRIPVGAETDTDKARDTDQPTVLGKDIATDADLDKDKTTNTDKDTSLPKPGDIPDLTLPQILTKKFPFSLPWDLYASVTMLAAPPTVPKYTVPFLHIAAWNINQDITIDMEKFEPVAVVCRWGFSALWIVGLIFLTKKLIWK